MLFFKKRIVLDTENDCTKFQYSCLKTVSWLLKDDSLICFTRLCEKTLITTRWFINDLERLACSESRTMQTSATFADRWRMSDYEFHRVLCNFFLCRTSKSIEFLSSWFSLVYVASAALNGSLNTTRAESSLTAVGIHCAWAWNKESTRHQGRAG